MIDEKAALQHYVREGREAVLWKVEGLSECDLRRPMTPTGTNVLGVVEHLATMELGYFGEVFGRPSGIPTPWMEPGAEFNADLWAAADESSAWVLDLYRRACAHARHHDRRAGPRLAGNGALVVERRRHAAPEPRGHDPGDQQARGPSRHRRDLVDGAVGRGPGNDNMTTDDQQQWRDHRDRLERIAREA